MTSPRSLTSYTIRCLASLWLMDLYGKPDAIGFFNRRARN